MKYPAAPSSQGPVTSLSPKLSATFTEGFASQYNSPKTISAKGFILSRNPYETPTLLLRSQKREYSYGQSKSKPNKFGNSSTVDNLTPTPKTQGSITLNSQNTVKEEKRSSSKQKCETLRTVSSTPKNTAPYKSPESVRREDTSFNSQFKWKKLEISTEFGNTKTSYNIKAQSTKHTETDENLAKELGTKPLSKQISSQSTQKSLQSKSDENYTFYTQQNEDGNKEKDNDSQARTTRPLANHENNPKTFPSSPQAPTKANHQLRGSSVKENTKSKATDLPDQESSTSKLSYRKGVAATPKASAVYGDLKSLAQNYSTEQAKRKERPLSAKKPPKDVKEDQQVERISSKDTPKNSLQSFVTKVNKGDVFSSIKRYGDKRDNSARRSQKPQLNLDDKSSKAIRAVDLDLKGSRTTPNVESKVFTINLSKGSASPTASSSQALVAKNNKSIKQGGVQPKESVRSSQDIVQNLRGKEPFIYYMTNLERAHRWAGEPDYFVQLYQEHFLQTFQALNFCKLLKPVDPAALAQKKVNLQKRDTHKDKKTLVFDMDETLIHCNESLDMPADVILPIVFPNGEVVEAGVNVRPYALECLRELSHYYEIIVFTASHSCYANVVLDYLDPHEEYIHHRLFRESCVVTEEGLHIKDLRVLANRNLQDVILIDNAAYSYGFQIENGIPIVPFYDNKADQELRHLIPYLKFLSSVKDLREINKQTFKLLHYSCYEEPEELLEKVILTN